MAYRGSFRRRMRLSTLKLADWIALAWIDRTANVPFPPKAVITFRTISVPKLTRNQFRPSKGNNLGLTSRFLMENQSTYFTRRAGEERARAAEATSAEARKAHIELAFRLTSVATEPASWRASLDSLNATHDVAVRQAAVSRSEVGKALVDAFALPASGAFANLLQAIDEPAPHKAGATATQCK